MLRAGAARVSLSFFGQWTFLSAIRSAKFTVRPYAIGSYYNLFVEVRVFADKKKEPVKEVWYEVPQPLEPVQKMLLIQGKVLLFRRTGIVQIVGAKDGGLLGAAKMDTNDDEAVDALELWEEEGSIFVLLSNGQIFQISLSEDIQVSFAHVKSLVSSGSDLITASHYADGYLSVGSKSLLPTIYNTKDSYKVVFSAKKPKADKLGMHVKCDVRSILYIAEDRLLVCGLASGQVWTYDISEESSSKKYGWASLQKELYKIPIISLTRHTKGSVLVANSRGSCESYSVDRLIRTGGFLGNSGAVSLVHFQSDCALGPLVTSTSMDRFVTVYESVSRKSLAKVFIGHVPVALMVLKVIAKECESTATDLMWSQLPKVKSAK